MTTLKGPGEALKFDGSPLRICIVHSRWNSTVIDALVAGARKTLLAAGVLEANIVTQSVPGSYELPFAVQRAGAAAAVQASTQGAVSAGDLLAGMSMGGEDVKSPTAPAAAKSEDKGASNAPFDAIIAIGVLIKGETMHFEYIADAVSHGLMKVQLESGIPVVFGLLTVLDEAQAKARAGLGGAGHNHGEDWGAAAVEMGSRKKGWVEGKFL